MNHERTFPDPDELVLEHLELVGKVVGDVSARYPRHVDRAELWNAGALGLVEASRRYDPESGIPFARYAAIRIRGAIIDSTRTRDWATRSVRRRLRDIASAREDLQSRLGRTPTTVEIAADLGITINDFHRDETDGARASLLQLDQDVDEEGTTLMDLMPDLRPETSPAERVDQKELAGALNEAVRLLPRAQSEAVRRSFLEGEPLADIAADMGLTEARLSQLRAEGLAALQAYFATQYDEIAPPDPAAPGKRARAAYLERMRSRSSTRSRLEAVDEI